MVNILVGSSGAILEHLRVSALFGDLTQSCLPIGPPMLEVQQANQQQAEPMVFTVVGTEIKDGVAIDITVDITASPLRKATEEEIAAAQ